jgi:3-methyladenine DNA glycosylase/8-oxoguanine DNA glycosylase
MIPTLELLDLPTVTRRLGATDGRLGRLIRRVGPFRPDWRTNLSPYEGLFRSIVFQQLSGQAASTILKRVLALFGDGAIPPPEQLLALPEERLRSAGLSRNKTAAIRDLARRTLEGTVPDRATARQTPDEELIERLVAVRGVGRWTAEMLLMFGLGRTDVLPVSDLGIRKGFQLTYEMKRLPAAVTITRQGRLWAPYRTVASWYLWRAVELTTQDSGLRT